MRAWRMVVCGGYVPDDKGWGRGKRPVINVSWNDAQAYVQWLSNKTGAEYHLLSESEWEYVARAGTSTARYWGESSSAQCRYANGADETARRYHRNLPIEECDDGHYHTASVGTYAANAFGLHDMLGNVWEWTQDCWIDNYHNISGDGSARESGDCSKRVFRGGSLEQWPHVPPLGVSHRGYLRTSGQRHRFSRCPVFFFISLVI